MATIMSGSTQRHSQASTSGRCSTCFAPIAPTTRTASRTQHGRGLVARGRRTVAFFQQADAAALKSTALLQEAPADGIARLDAKPKLTLSWAGAGIFFFWQLGAMKYLSERYDLTRVPMAGASGGALAAVLAACGVSAERAFQRAYEKSVEYGIWERPLGLMGVWGALIEEWLDELLPDDAAERCRNRVTVVVTTLPNMAQTGITDFTDKKDLINAVMASAHVPMLLDLKFARLCRGKYCIDGSAPDFFYNDNSELLKAGGSAVIFDYFQDKNLVRKGRMDMLQLKTLDEVKHIMEVGYRYAQQLHHDGHFEHMEVGEVVLDHLEEAERANVMGSISSSNGVASTMQQ